MISIEIRKLIMRAKNQGKSVVEIMYAYHVKRTAVYNLYKLVNETGSVEPRIYKRGRKAVLNEERLKELEQLIIATPDITLAEMKERMNLEISLCAISKTIKNKLHYRYKKKRYTPKNNNEMM